MPIAVEEAMLLRDIKVALNVKTWCKFFHLHFL